MNKFILSLRKLSLRWVIVAVPVIFWGSGALFTDYDSDRLYYLFCLFTTVAIACFYITFAIHAIKDERRALKTSYLFIAACAVLLLESSNAIALMAPIGLAIIFPFHFFEHIGSIYEKAEFMFLGSSETEVFLVALMNLFMLTGLLYSTRSVSQRYKSAWRMAIVAQAFSACGVLMVVITGSRNLGGILNIFSGLVSFVLFVLLLVIGGKERKNMEKSNMQTPTPSPQVHNDISSKSEELTKLKSLLDAGVLTQEEFDSEKKKILNS